MNLLLGIFYNNFKFRFEMNLENSKEKRSEYLFSRYVEFGGGKGYLDKTETYQMFLMIHGLASASLKNQVVSKEEADEELNKSSMTSLRTSIIPNRQSKDDTVVQTNINLKRNVRIKTATAF